MDAAESPPRRVIENRQSYRDRSVIYPPCECSSRCAEEVEEEEEEEEEEEKEEEEEEEEEEEIHRLSCACSH